ncbi:DNA polymerase alpha catalytic subunit isoform X3 [Fopius arisanus]|uniref:DNA-directed DNA polymerase n=1 Tax=Fopius arisanus TaxID=64838 RepID=A0A0C9RQ00_9HYME|nr:PREDICTED: DNA polymerase alpha catalytic subunit-like isoform X3 [Fopius arisanus]
MCRIIEYQYRRIINVKDKKTFSGGRVLEVIARMHVDTTLLMDFKSLYPNIIREYNICFTTMPGVCFKSFDEIYVQLNAPMGIIPKLVGDIVEARSKAKCHMNTPNISLAEKAKYQAQQLALKLIANTLYGSFGSIYFRFYARNIAAKITAKGREILMNAVTMAKSNTFSTIYGDTDSLIIDTMQRDPTEARRIAGVIKNVVNQQYQFIELELEAIYKYIIIVNRKQYTGLSLIDLPDGKSQLVLEGKGTLPKKGSNCQLVISIVEHVTKQMFNDELYPKRRKKVAEYLQKLAKEANENPSQFENDLVITQKVGSHSNLWLSCKSNHEKLPHDNTDNKTNKDGSNCKSDESISYIIRSDGTSRSPEERAYLQTDGKQFPPDINYYFISQLIPRLQNVFRPMDDLSSSFFAKHLGLKDQYNTIPGVEPVANEEQHKSIKVCPLAEPVTITCRKCGVAQSMNGFIREGQEGRDSVPFLSACLNDECDCAPWRYVDGILEDLDYAIANFLEEHPPKVRCAYIKYKKGSSEYIEFRCNYIVDNIDEIPATCPTCNHSSKFAVDLPAPLVYARIRQLREFFNVNAQSNLVKESLTKEVTDAYIFLWHALDRLINRRRMSVINMKKLHRRHE